MLTTEQAQQVLQQQKQEAEQLLRHSTVDETEYRIWAAHTCDYITEAFANPDRHITTFISSGPDYVNVDVTQTDRQSLLRAGLQQQMKVIDGLLFRMFKDQHHAASPSPRSSTGHTPPCVFIGHGRSKLWARLKLYLADDLKLKTVFYESESRVGESIVPVLEKMLSEATFAVLVLTAEDETQAGQARARQNVVHEAGLFQGKLGFGKAVLLVQQGIEHFSNVDGLQHIPFAGEAIEQTFYELQRVLKREGLIP
jgi:predicted nucleotide-binding protein